MTAPNKELLKNNASTMLNGGIDDNDTPITVTDGSVFPSTGDFRLIVDSELMLCTARSGNSLTVTRGVEGSTPASHSNGATVTHIATAGGQERWGRDNDPMFNSNRPALGRLVDDAGTTILTASDFTAVNAGGSDVVSDQNGTILMRKAAQTGIANQVHALVRSAPATPYAYIACFEAIFFLGATSVDRPNFGMLFRESSTGKLVSWQLSSEGGTGQEWLAWVIASHTSPTATPAVLGGFSTLRAVNIGPRIWMKIEDDGTDLVFYIGNDGFNWLEIFTVDRDTFMTGGANQVGWFANNYENNQQMLVRLCHWSKE